jgi:hypothetical protein
MQIKKENSKAFCHRAHRDYREKNDYKSKSLTILKA